MNADLIDRTFLEKRYGPPDSGKVDEISANVSAASKAITPFRAKASIALGPVAAKLTPARARIPPPTIAPTPIPVAPNNPMVRLIEDSCSVFLMIIYRPESFTGIDQQVLILMNIIQNPAV